MATVYAFYPNPNEFYKQLQEKYDNAELERLRIYPAVLLLQRVARGYLIRKYIKRLNKTATVIQSAFRKHQARKELRRILRETVRLIYLQHYWTAATHIQAAWRGYLSRKHKFCYQAYKRWLTSVAESGKRRAAEAAEFGIRSRAENLIQLEENARQWLALVVFRLHHLLRTYSIAGVYSIPESHELSEFEKLLKAISYKEYMVKLKEKYDEYVRKRRPMFSNKKLFPIIGDGSEYWYLTLTEMYELTAPSKPKKDTRHVTLHHGPIHKRPFLWKKIESPKPEEGRGPFMPTKSETKKLKLPISKEAGDSVQHDPRFNLYVKHYTPQPNLFKYINLQVNALIARSLSIENINKPTRFL